ncbi:MAG: hypothetical protein V3W14_07845 [Candidatus Neomarinimicrobiota bacterium]
MNLMAEIHTFSAVLFHSETSNAVTPFMAPPSNVIVEDERPVSVETLIRVAREQAVLPAKSTYFYPKFLLGFVNADLD